MYCWLMAENVLSVLQVQAHRFSMQAVSALVSQEAEYLCLALEADGRFSRWRHPARLLQGYVEEVLESRWKLTGRWFERLRAEAATECCSHSPGHTEVEAGAVVLTAVMDGRVCVYHYMSKGFTSHCTSLKENISSFLHGIYHSDFTCCPRVSVAKHNTAFFQLTITIGYLFYSKSLEMPQAVGKHGGKHS